MNAEVKEKWLAALRSGDYRKAKGRLSRGRNRRCCLGVLRDLVGGDERDWHSNLSLDTEDRVGLNYSAQYELVDLNDRRRGWGPVCDYIEGRL